MWRCEKCNRRFKSKNQSHSCTDIDMGELFIGKPDELVLAFDKLLHLVVTWKPNEVATATKSIVFTSHKAWLIVKPMKSVLDIKFYLDRELTSSRIFKRSKWGKKFAHHIRISHQDEIDDEVVKLIKHGFEFSINL